MKFIALVCLSTVVACGPSDQDGCQEFADLGASKIGDCGGDIHDVKEWYSKFDDKGGCDEMSSLRDADQFFDECLPGVKRMTCEDVRTGNAPVSCAAQLYWD